MLGAQGVAVNLDASGLGVDGVQVKPVGAGDQIVGLVQILSELPRRAGRPRVVPRDRDAAVQNGIGRFKAAHVVPLPTVEADGDLGQRL